MEQIVEGIKQSRIKVCEQAKLLQLFHQFSICCQSICVTPGSLLLSFPDGEEEAGEQDEERSAERRVPRAARQTEALLQNRQGL